MTQVEYRGLDLGFTSLNFICFYLIILQIDFLLYLIILNVFLKILSQRTHWIVDASSSCSSKRCSKGDANTKCRSICSSVSPIQSTECILREAIQLQQKHNHKHVDPFIRLSQSTFAIHLSQLDDIFWLPSYQPYRVQDSCGMHVKHHESEECIQYLVWNFKPSISIALLWNHGIQHPHHDHEQDGSCHGNCDHPYEEC